MLVSPRTLACALLLQALPACKKGGEDTAAPEPAATNADAGGADAASVPLDGDPVSERAKEISVELQPVELSQCKHSTTDTDPPEQVYSCKNLIAVHMVVADAAPDDDRSKAALDAMLAGMQEDGTLEVVKERDTQVPLGGETRPGKALLIRNPDQGDSIGAYTWAEKDGASHLLFCMAPGYMFFEGRCDPVWDQLLEGP